jgi:hypothetical protein
VYKAIIETLCLFSQKKCSSIFFAKILDKVDLTTQENNSTRSGNNLEKVTRKTQHYNYCHFYYTVYSLYQGAGRLSTVGLLI